MNNQDNIELQIKKERFKLLNDLHELAVKKRELERINDWYENTLTKLDELDTNPSFYFKNKESYNRIEQRIKSYPVAKGRELVLINSL